MTEEDRKQRDALIQTCVDKLREHFDSVRIFVTCPSSDGEPNTAALDIGSGNFYAQLGQIQEWLAIQEQYQRNWATRNEEL